MAQLWNFIQIHPILSFVVVNVVCIVCGLAVQQGYRPWLRKVKEAEGLNLIKFMKRRDSLKPKWRQRLGYPLAGLFCLIVMVVQIVASSGSIHEAWYVMPLAIIVGLIIVPTHRVSVFYSRNFD